ncbi:MAG: polymer-forming cytoskeletal protein [Gemmatimonadales bacterium]|nr:polymer-forming cytoskeletal protein [Gemmatimonadales bacterium]
MNATAVTIFLAATILWFLLPLLPAIIELLRPTDLAPLTVVPRDAGDVAFLAKGFRGYLAGQLDRLPAETPADFLGRLPDGTLFGRVREATGVLAPGQATVQDRVMVLETGAPVPGDQTFVQEIHARAPFLGGPRTAYRAILADQGATLGEGSRVLRWIHAAGPLDIGAGSALAGRASSDRAVRLGPGVRFDRIGAPEIVTSGTAPAAPAPAAPRTPFVPPEDARRIGDHLRIEADLHLPAGTDVDGNLVVRGRLVVGRGSRIRGSIKTHGEILIEPEVEITGSLVSRAPISVGQGGFVAGPIIGEDEVRIAAGSVIGTGGAPTTIAARSLTLGPATTIFGQITTQAGGTTATT